jgi:hypothetical protein
MIAGKPDDNETVRLTNHVNGQEAIITSSSAATTDANGDYQFQRVIPGQARVYRMVRLSLHQAGHTVVTNRMGQFETIYVAPAQSITLNFGGEGRPVIGKVVLPTGLSMQNFLFNNSVSGQTPAAGEALPPQMPDKIKNGTVAERQMWMQLFELTAAGKEFVTAHPPLPPTLTQYPINFNDAGTFRIDDVLPGDYNLNVSANPRGGSALLLPYFSTFIVPPVPGGGYSDEPLVLPDIQLSTR